MLGGILYGEVKRPVVAHNVVNQAIDLGVLDLDVGGDATALTHLATSSSVEHACKRVGHALVGAVLVAVRVVNLLDEASAGYVVLGDCHLEQSAKGQWAGRLHQSLAKGACAYDDCTVKVLQRACGNLARRCAVAVDQHCQWYGGVDGVLCGLVCLLALLVATASHQHLSALGHEVAHNLDGTLHESATVATQVECEELDIGVLLELEHGVLDTLGRLLVEGGEVHISYATAHHAIVGHGVNLDGLASDVNGDDAVLYPWTLYGEREVSVGLSLEVAAHTVA